MSDLPAKKRELQPNVPLLQIKLELDNVIIAMTDEDVVVRHKKQAITVTKIGVGAGAKKSFAELEADVESQGCRFKLADITVSVHQRVMSEDAMSLRVKIT